MDKKKTNKPLNESKSDCFKRVVVPRVDRAVKAISLVGSCTGSAYEYGPKEVAAIVKTLTESVEETTRRLKGEGVSESGFSF